MRDYFLLNAYNLGYSSFLEKTAADYRMFKGLAAVGKKVFRKGEDAFRSAGVPKFDNVADVKNFISQNSHKMSHGDIKAVLRSSGFHTPLEVNSLGSRLPISDTIKNRLSFGKGDGPRISQNPTQSQTGFRSGIGGRGERVEYSPGVAGGQQSVALSSGKYHSYKPGFVNQAKNVRGRYLAGDSPSLSSSAHSYKEPVRDLKQSIDEIKNTASKNLNRADFNRVKAHIDNSKKYKNSLPDEQWKSIGDFTAPRYKTPGTF